MRPRMMKVMKPRIIKTVLSICMISVLVLTTASQVGKADDSTDTNNSMSATEAADIKSKSEVVYATLSPNGTTNGIYVVNHFEIGKGGSITDYGDYQSVLNLTESKPITVDGDMITAQTEAENFYYQGNLTTMELPWMFEITYTLDGVSVSPEEIAGKTGTLDIHMKVTNNEKVNSTFFENYMLQISMTLDSNKSNNIDAPDATIADAGNNKMLAFTVLPNKGAEFQVKADVKDFTMKGVEISAIPFSMNVDIQDADEMIKEFNQLPEAISELNDGVGKLAEGTGELKKGANKLKNGSSDLKQGLLELKNNSGAITDASAQIHMALLQISSALKAGSTSEVDLSDLTQLPGGLSQLADGLQAISGGLNELKNGYAMAYSALELTIQGIPDTAITKEQLDNEFPDANSEQRKLLDQLYASYTAGQTVKMTFSQVKQAFDVVVPTIDTLSANIDTISGTLDGISTQIGTSLSDMDILDQLSQLTVGLSDLASNYSTFDKGLNQYLNGVGSLADGYNQFHTGVTKFGSGVGELNNGVDELYAGTGQLNEEVSKMPEKIQEEIDKMVSEYDSKDFIPVSFVSSKNKNVTLVQFVLKCEGIELPETAKVTDTVESDSSKETVWDRFIALFK